MLNYPRITRLAVGALRFVALHDRGQFLLRILVGDEIKRILACLGDPLVQIQQPVGELTPEAALKLSVDFAIERKLDAVLFAGDVVENTNARFEAMLPLEESVRRLLDEGIQVIAVAGNHDVEALPRLAALIDGFTLLGAGGRWEARTLTKNQSPFAEVIGWSFGSGGTAKTPCLTLVQGPQSGSGKGQNVGPRK